jgi:xanthine dehydrogenase small subunit
MASALRFVLDGVPREVRGEPPTRTLLQWLRATGKVGTKEGCAEGDCGACTVVLEDAAEGAAPRLRAVNSCILLLPMVDGRRVWTVEGIGRPEAPHPVQQAMAGHLGSQCGYCTPGFVMTLLEAHHRTDLDAPWKLDDQLCGNLCRCTGYRPIQDAARAVAGTANTPAPACAAVAPRRAEPLDYTHDGAAFLAPHTLEQAVGFLDAHPGARVVAGATDLGLNVTQRGETYAALLSVEHIAELRGITQVARDGRPVWRVGAATDLVSIEDWSAGALPVWHRMLRYFGSRQIKHRATLGGNLVNASPIGDNAPVMLALDAVMVVAGSEGERRIPAETFFTGYRATALRPGELLVAVEIPALSATARTGAYKVSRRREMDISAVSACYRLELDGDRIVDARVAHGGVAATPVRLPAVEGHLRGARWTDDVAHEAAVLAAESVRPMDDLRGSAAFRRTLVRNLLLGFREETRDATFRALPHGHVGTVVLGPAAPGGAA